MEAVSRTSIVWTCKNYLSLTKPGIIMGNSINAIAGFALASQRNVDFFLFLAVLLGLSFIIGSACVFNNYIDRELDKKMERTKNRPLVIGSIQPQNALIFGSVLLLLGGYLLLFWVNFLTASIALFGFAVYVGVYSFLKYITMHGTLIGSIAGAVPPIVGYAAVANSLDLGAAILFLIITTWQMPHFFAIALYRIEDYEAGNIPTLPLVRGILATKVQMFFYILAFIVSCTLLVIYNYVTPPFLFGMGGLSVLWLCLNIYGIPRKDHKAWARKMFVFSLVIVMVLCILIPTCI